MWYGVSEWRKWCRPKKMKKSRFETRNSNSKPYFSKLSAKRKDPEMGWHQWLICSYLPNVSLCVARRFSLIFWQVFAAILISLSQLSPGKCICLYFVFRCRSWHILLQNKCLNVNLSEQNIERITTHFQKAYCKKKQEYSTLIFKCIYFLIVLLFCTVLFLVDIDPAWIFADFSSLISNKL